jgi:DNA-binding NarL/FixJ family response regulator
MRTNTSLESKKPAGKTACKTVFLIDDHPLLVQGLTELINAQADLEVVGESDDWTVALKKIGELNPDILVLDITLRNANGLEVLKNLRVHHPDLKVLMLSMHEENLYAMRTMKAGAHGYIMKGCAAEELIGAIRQIVQGGIYLSDALARRTMQQMVGRKTEVGGSPLEDLSDRQLEVFNLIGDGLTTRRMAEKLHLSIKTIETHKAHIKEKLNLANSAALTQHAIHWRG